MPFPDEHFLSLIRAGNITQIPGNVFTYVSTWTYRECIPVTVTTYSEKSGREYVSFYDVTLGIRDPNVFIPRPECLTENPELQALL